MIGNILDIFRAEKQETPEEEDEKLAEIMAKKQVDKEVFSALLLEFGVDKTRGLKPSVSPESEPNAVLRNENQVFTLWYRLPVRSSSKLMNILDFAIFRGTHRAAPRTNPDIVIECRRLETGRSNRTDPRLVKEMVGLSLDALPGMVILATNRELSEFAQELAKSYGIKLVNMSGEKAGDELLMHITSDRQTTRAKLLQNLESGIDKIEALVTKREALPWGKRIIEERKERLKDKVEKELSKGHSTVAEIAKKLHSHEDFVLNELYALEKENRAQIVERSINGEKKNVWALIPKPRIKGSSR